MMGLSKHQKTRVFTNRVRRDLGTGHIDSMCSVDCNVPCHAFHSVRFKPDTSTAKGRPRWVDLTLDLRPDLCCSGVATLQDDHWCLVESFDDTP